MKGTSWWRVAKARLRALVSRNAVADEIREEIQFHLDERIDAHVRSGMSRADAARAAVRRFGNPAVVIDRGYDVRGGGLMESLVQDVRLALRLLRKQPRFSIVALATLALGMGATTAIFCVADAALIRPLPYDKPEQLVRVSLRDLNDPAASGRAPSLDDMDQWRSLTQLFSAVCSFRGERRIVIDGGGPEAVNVTAVTHDYLPMYGQTPIFGRAFTMDDERLGAPLVALLGYRYWQSHYNGDPDIVGKTIRFSADAATIVGVLGDDQSPAPDKILMPLQATPDRRGARQYAVYARLRDGVTLAQAQHDTDALLAGLAASPLYAHLGTTITRRYDSETASRRPTMNVLFGAVGFVLLIACVNVASLQLARGSTRNVEFAIRSSLGAGRMRLVRQLIVESLVLSLIGCALGCLVAWLTLGTIVANLPMYLPSAVRITITWPALLAAAAVSLVSGVAFGLMPAFRSSRSDLTRVLGRATRAGHGALSRTAGRVLITIEIAAAVILLVGATLMVVSFARLADVPLGFDTDRFVTIEATPIDDRSDAYRAYYASLLERIRALPGVDSAGGTNMLPLGGSYSFGQVETAHGKRGVILGQATPGYFETLDITLRAGRLPQGRDFDDANWVVFSENAATSLFSNEPAVGQSVRIADTWRTVIGVVGDVKDQGAVRVLKAPGIYTSFQTAPDRTLSGRDIGQPMIVVAHAAVMDGAFMDALRRAASEAAPSVIRAVRPSHEWWSDNVVTPRQRTVLLSILGGLGLLLALVGVFGVTSFSISRRTAEIGVRTAFGATGGHIIRMVMRDAWLPIAGGLALGLAGAVYLSKLIESFLFQTTSRDPPSFAAAAVILAMCGLAAAWLPARRAAQIDPVAALRQE